MFSRLRDSAVFKIAARTACSLALTAVMIPASKAKADMFVSETASYIGDVHPMCEYGPYGSNYGTYYNSSQATKSWAFDNDGFFFCCDNEGNKLRRGAPADSFRVDGLQPLPPLSKPEKAGLPSLQPKAE